MDATVILRGSISGIIEGLDYSDSDKKVICSSLLKAQDIQGAKKFHIGVRHADNSDGMYPIFYVPPYNGNRKNRLVTGELPKTHILSANHYELEIVRLLLRWGREDTMVQDIAEATRQRLTRPCFARFCPQGECVGAGVSALRFFSEDSLFSPGIARLLNPLGELFLDHRSQKAKDLPFYYFLLALSELSDKTSLQLLSAKQEYLLELLGKDWLTGPAEGDTYNATRKYVLRNALSRLPRFSYLRDRKLILSGCSLPYGDG
ncbi:MAG: hypothetical protein AB9835_03000 [Eubacteriales bacterium]